MNTITERALLRRINRKLAKQHEVVRCCRQDSRAFNNLGRYYVLDSYFNTIIASGIDIEALGREVEVLGSHEELRDE